jgi:lysozyme family protein
MDVFEKALKIILLHEGGYVNDPDDPGGETNFGISKRAYPNVDIKNLTEQEAGRIYKKDYWEVAKCDQIENAQIAVHVFDMAVNAGVKRSVELLQRAVGTIVDGRIGPMTLKAVNGHPRQSELVWRYKYERVCHYARIAGKNTKLAKFLNGWISRVESTNIYSV